MKRLYAKGMLRLQIKTKQDLDVRLADHLGIELKDLVAMYMIEKEIPEKTAIKICMYLQVPAKELYVYADNELEALELEYRNPSKLDGWRMLFNFVPLLEKGIIGYEE